MADYSGLPIPTTPLTQNSLYQAGQSLIQQPNTYNGLSVGGTSNTTPTGPFLRQPNQGLPSLSTLAYNANQPFNSGVDVNTQGNFGLPTNPYGYSSGVGGMSAGSSTPQYSTGAGLSNSDIKNYVNTLMSRGGNYQNVYDAASAFGVSPQQLESAMGWAPGTVDKWSFGAGNPSGQQPLLNPIGSTPGMEQGSSGPTMYQNLPNAHVGAINAGWMPNGQRQPNGFGYNNNQTMGGNISMASMMNNPSMFQTPGAGFRRPPDGRQLMPTLGQQPISQPGNGQYQGGVRRW